MRVASNYWKGQFRRHGGGGAADNQDRKNTQCAPGFPVTAAFIGLRKEADGNHIAAFYQTKPINGSTTRPRSGITCSAIICWRTGLTRFRVLSGGATREPAPFVLPAQVSAMRC